MQSVYTPHGVRTSRVTLHVYLQPVYLKKHGCYNTSSIDHDRLSYCRVKFYMVNSTIPFYILELVYLQVLLLTMGAALYCSGAMTLEAALRATARANTMY